MREGGEGREGERYSLKGRPIAGIPPLHVRQLTKQTSGLKPWAGQLGYTCMYVHTHTHIPANVTSKDIFHHILTASFHHILTASFLM